MSRVIESSYPDVDLGVADLERPQERGSDWRRLYRIAGWSAATAAVITPISIAIFVIWPPPYDGTSLDWFELFQKSRLLGMASLDLPFLLISALMIPVMLAVYIALRRVDPSIMLLALGLYIVAVATYFASNTSVEMLSLSSQYAAAGTAAERAALSGAAEAMFATYQGTAFHTYYILGQIAGILAGVVMLRTTLFRKRVAYTMIGGNVLGFGLYLPTVGLVVSALSGLVLWIWMVLVAKRFFQLGRVIGDKHA